MWRCRYRMEGRAKVTRAVTNVQKTVLARTKVSTLPWAEFVAGYQRGARFPVWARADCVAVYERNVRTHHPPFKLFEWYIALWIEIKIHRLLSRFLKRYTSYRDIRRAGFRYAAPLSALSRFPASFAISVSREKYNDAQTHGRQDTIQENSVCITSVNFISLGEPTRVPSLLLAPLSVCSPRHADMSCTRENMHAAPGFPADPNAFL